MKNKTTKVRAAVVGLGWPGMQHLKGYTIDPRSEVIAVCDLDEKRTQEVAKEHDIPNAYTNHLEMLDNKDTLMSRVSAFDEFCYKINTDSF